VQITTVEEAKRFYPLFGLGANVALVFSGRTVKYFSHLRNNLGPGVDGWAISLKAMMSIVVGMGLAICAIYWWVNSYVPLPTRSKKKKVVFCQTYILSCIHFFYLRDRLKHVHSIVSTYSIFFVLFLSLLFRLLRQLKAN